MEFEIYKNLDELMSVYKNVSAINFGGKNLNKKRDDEILIIGPEGGFSDDETAKFKKFALIKGICDIILIIIAGI